MLTWKYRPSAALVGAPFGASAWRPSGVGRTLRSHIKLLDTYLPRGYQGARYTSWWPASRLVALPEGEQGCSEADFPAVPVGAALGLADRASVARGSADLDSVGPGSVVTAGADMADQADTDSVHATSAWWSVRLPCCSTERRTPSRSCSVFLRRPT